ncbi:MAG: uracil-DNA glycosylase, partial [Balneolaceae bacterium]
VFGTGNPNASLMIIGEAPGYYEDQQGEPFVGKAGELLNKILESIRFRREEVYIANILKHRPPKNRDPKPEERERSLPYLIRQIELVDPSLILCLGRISATTLLGTDDSLKNLRGRLHSFMNRELMVTYHPAALLRNPQWKRPVWEDVQLLRRRYDELQENP